MKFCFDNFIGSDYDTPPTTVWISAGRTVGSFYITTRNDRILELNESFIVTVTSPSADSNCSATVTIIDNDGNLCTQLHTYSSQESLFLPVIIHM